MNTILKPVTTEKAIRLIEIDNTLLFEVDSRANKTEIAKQFEKLFNVKVEKVGTLKRANKKIAYIKINKKTPAIDIATKLGMI